MKPLLVCLILLAAAVSALAADNARIWEQSGYEDFDKGTLQKVSLRSDGKITLAPRFRQIADPGLNYVWAVAEDRRGNIYMGGGSPAKVIRVNLSRGLKDGQAATDTVFSAKELEVHAIAVDEHDNLFVATSPDPKVYRVTPDGKSTVFFEPKAKYVWALAFDRDNNLLIATGDKGELFRVNAKGEGKVFFSSDESHVRSLALDRSGNAIIGTDPGGLIMRVSPKGDGFVLYQAAKKEVTAIEIGPDGSIYAAAVGDKSQRMGAPPPVMPVQAVPVAAGVPPPIPVGITPLPPPPIAGGTELYRILPDGEPRRIWLSKDDIVYALAFGHNGLLLGSGNKGRIFQVNGDDSYSNLLKAQATQVTAFLRRRAGGLLAATSNIGRLLEIGAEYEAEGSFESEVFDARNFARWGRVFWRADKPSDSNLVLYTRTGNVDNPDRNWSPWSPALNTPGDKSPSPGARFIQWKAMLTSSNGKATPWLDTVEIAYLPKNLAPSVEEIDITPAGYRFQPAPAPVPAAQTLSLPPLGQNRPPTPGVSTPRFDPPAQLTAQKGAQGVRWLARDDNDDKLLFQVYVRGKEESGWKLLKDKVTDRFYSWDSVTFPDGVYFVKIVASDSPSNPEGETLSGQRESGPFIVDNTPPQVAGLKAASSGGKRRVTFQVRDALSPIRRAEYSVDGGEWQLILPVDQLADSLEEDYSFEVDATSAERTVAVRVFDRVENVVVEKLTLR